MATLDLKNYTAQAVLRGGLHGAYDLHGPQIIADQKLGFGEAFEQARKSLGFQ